MCAIKPMKSFTEAAKLFAGEDVAFFEPYNKIADEVAASPETEAIVRVLLAKVNGDEDLLATLGAALTLGVYIGIEMRK